TSENRISRRNVGKLVSKNCFDGLGIVRKGKKRTITFGRAIVSKNLSEDSLVSSIKDSMALLHFIGKGRQTVYSEYENVNVDTTRDTIQLCKRASIKKIIYISNIGYDQESTRGYFIQKYKSEQEI